MNKLKGTITRIESSQHMSMVDIDAGGTTLTAIVLNTPADAPYLKQGGKVTACFKETEVSLAKGLSGQISLRNRAAATVSSVEKSALLSKVTLTFQGTTIVSVISTRSAEAMKLAAGDQVEWLVNTNEVSLWT